MWKKLLLALLVVVTAVAAARTLRQAPPPRVETVALERADLVSTLALTGTLTNDRTVTLTALLDGEITAIEVREGESAAAGQTLAELDARQPRAQLEQAVAERELARLELDAARASHERLTNMPGNVSPQALEDSALALERARAALSVARSTARVAELQLANARVRAPFDGTVTERTAEVGQWIEAGTQLFTLVAHAGQVIEAEVDASDFERVAVGQGASLATESAPARRWRSTLDWVAPAISDGDGGSGVTFAVRLAPGDGAPPMLIGQQLDVDLELERRDGVPSLPLAALRQDGADSWSALVLEDGLARRRSVEVGLTTLDRAEIRGGLDADATVIVPFGDTPADGQRVSAPDGTGVS